MERPKFSDKDKIPPRRPLRTGGQIARGERLRPSEEEINELGNWIKRQVSENLSIASEDEPDSFTPKVEQRLKDRILRAFGEEVSKKNQREGKNRKSDWEPFINEPDAENQKLIVTYSGPYAQVLEINRKNAERLIEVVGFGGNIILTDLKVDRNRSISGVNPDGSVAAKRRLFFGEKLELPSKETSNKPYRVAPTDQGWLIEIAGQNILEDLSGQDSIKSLEQRFVQKFNVELGSSLISVLGKDKFNIREFSAKYRLFQTLAVPATSLSRLSDGFQTQDLRGPLFWLVTWGITNVLGLGAYWSGVTPERFFRKSLNSFYEIIMPPVEIDRYLRGLAFLNFKGRNLVRLAPQDQRRR